MRKLAASFFMSLDGVVDSPQDWHFPYMNDEIGAVIGAGMSADTIVLGRRTYEEWAAFWPQQPSDDGMAGFINGTPKLVASRTLQQVEWDTAELIRGDVAEALADLKQGPGGEIAINGSGTLVSSLLEAGLVDELRLLVHPVLVGRGKHLFENGAGPKGLELAESHALGNGVLNLTFRRAPAPA
jgi:dihydrofolate reductase